MCSLILESGYSLHALQAALRQDFAAFFHRDTTDRSGKYARLRKM